MNSQIPATSASEKAGPLAWVMALYAVVAVGRLGDAIHRYIIMPSKYGSGLMTLEVIPLPALLRTIADQVEHC